MSDTAPECGFITVVSGLPRSGTSLMMAMLEAGGIPALTDGVRAADEDNTKGYYEYEPVKSLRRDASWVGRARGKAVKVIHALLDALPEGFEYRVIFMRRDLREVVASQGAMLARSGRKGGRITEDQLLTLYRREYEKAEGWLGARANMRALFVDYNALVRDPRGSIDPVVEFLRVARSGGGEGVGRGWGGGGARGAGELDAEAMLGVVDPSLYRQRRG